MKNIIIFCLLTVLPMTLFSQRGSNYFYHKYKRAENTTNFKLPGLVLRMGASIGKGQMDKEDKKAMAGLKLIKSVKSMKLLLMEDVNLVSEKDYNKLVSDVKRKGKMSEMITVREGSTRINIMVRDKRKKISRLMILVSEEDGFIMLSMKTKLKYKDLNKLLQEFMKDDEKIKIAPEESEKAIEKIIERA